jgi:small nuclear ribonucleoprotein (snRNP)-like protein
MRVTLNDGRQMTGQMLAFDKVRRISCPFDIID